MTTPYITTVTIGGETIRTDKLVIDEPAVVGPLVIERDNGGDIGQLITSSVTLTVQHHGNLVSKLFKRGLPVEVRVGMDDWSNLVYSGFISEASIERCTHERLGPGIRHKITAVSLAEFYGDQPVESFGALTTVRRVTDMYDRITTAIMDTFPGVTSPGSYRMLPRVSGVLTQNLDYWNRDTETLTSATTMIAPDELFNYLSGYIEPGKTYTLKEALELLGTITFSRPYINGNRIELTPAVQGINNIARRLVLPSSAAAATSDVASRISAYWDSIYVRTRRSATEDTTGTTGWGYPTEAGVPGPSRWEYDWGDKVADSQEFPVSGQPWWTTSMIRHMTLRPRDDWSVPTMRLYLDKLAGRLGSAIMAVFNPLTYVSTSPALPTFIFGVDNLLAFAVGRASIQGVVETATLTINPKGNPRPAQFILDVTLGPGDFRPHPASTSLEGPRWEQVVGMWEYTGPLERFSDRYLWST